jgi:hypothetical protein
MEEADKQVPKQLQPYIWKKGRSGNPNGRPKGKTLKEFAREYLMTLPDNEKIDYLASLPTEIVWKMAEGNPQTNNDVTSGGEPLKGVVILPSKDVSTLETTGEAGDSTESE